MKSYKIWRVFLINLACHTYLKFWIFLAEDIEFIRSGLRHQHQLFCFQLLLIPKTLAMYKNSRSEQHKKWISQQKLLKLQIAVAETIFKLHPLNSVGILTTQICKDIKTFVKISEVVSDLTKISVSVPSKSWEVLGLWNRNLSFYQLCTHS